MAALGSHVEPGWRGPWGGEKFSPILPMGLWSGPPSLPHWHSRETDIPSSIIDRKPLSPWFSNGNPASDCKVERSHPLPCCPSRSATAVHSPRAKRPHSPEREAEVDHPGDPPPQRQREEDPLAGHLGDSHCEAFCKDWDLVQCLRWTYFRTHPLTFYKKVIYKLTNVFREMADTAGLLGTKVHPVQDQWKGREELCSANYVVRGSANDLHYFRVVSPLTPQNNGSPGHTLPKALKHQACLSFCLWCGKEGKNEDTIVNHLHTRHYHLGLVCKRCLSYFMTASDKMWHHAQGCEHMQSCEGNPDREAEKSPWYLLDQHIGEHPTPLANTKDIPQYNI